MMDRSSHNLEDSLQLLGVDLEQGRSAARQAYLALLRHHKPEVDPEGFKRLRSAWEKVAAAFDGGRGQVAWELGVGNPSSDPQLSLQQPSPGPPTASPTRPSDPDEDLEAVGVRRGGELPPWMSSAIEAFVDHAGSMGVEIDLQRLRLGWGRVPQVTMAYANELLAQGHADLATEMVCAQLDASQAHASCPSLHPFVVLQLVLRLVETEHVVASRRLIQTFERCLVNEGREASLGDDIAAMWVLTRELDALPDAFPTAARSIIASAIAAASLASARGPLTAFAIADPAAADVARAYLYHQTPNLYGALNDALRPSSRPPVNVAHRAAERWAAFAAMVLALMVLAWMASPGAQRAPVGAGGFAEPSEASLAANAQGLSEECAARATPCPRLVWWVRQLDAGRCVPPDEGLGDSHDGFKRGVAGALRERYTEQCERR